MPAVAAKNPVSLRVQLSLPEDVITHYDHKAREVGLTFETLIALHLVETAKWASQRPLYLTDDDRHAMEKLFSRNLRSAKELVEQTAKLARVQIGTVLVNLNENIITRLRSRCPRQEQFENFVARNVKELIERFVELR